MIIEDFFKKRNIIDTFLSDHKYTPGDKIWLYNVYNNTVAILNYIELETKGIRFKEKTRTRLKQTLDTLLLLDQMEEEIFGVEEYKKILDSKTFFEIMAVDYLSLLGIKHDEDIQKMLSKEDQKIFKSLKGKSFNLTPHKNMEEVEDRHNGFIAKNIPITSKDVYYLTFMSFDLIIKDKDHSENLTKELFDEISNNEWKIRKSQYDYISINGQSISLENAEYPGSSNGKKYSVSDNHYWKN